jgi:hypothetical protein
MDPLQVFAEDLRQEVLNRAESQEDGGFLADTFTEVLLEYYQEAGDFEDAVACSHQSTGPRNAILQMSGYGLSDNGESLDLFITAYSGDVPPGTLGATEVKKYFDRLARIYNEASSGGFQNLEESGPAFDALQSIWQARKVAKTLLTVRLVLLTDCIVTTPPPKDQDKDAIRINFDIRDIERLRRLKSSGMMREQIEIDFEEVLGAPIPCLVQPASNSEYAAYLAIFPGRALVELYGKYGARLLERNVRSFLQVRGKINRGIRDTIVHEPHMFLAFNNGLSVTAEQVNTVALPGGGIGIKSIRDLQIVNGGQTTASIFHASKRDKNADIDRISVQVKLTILSDPGRMDEVIPLISRYANSQNSIQAADLVANDAYHRRVEELSRTIWAPAKDGTIRQTRWFYERARGQYADELARERTPAKIKAFQAAHPKAQVFTKTDLAQFLLTWERQPHLVSRGSQKCLVAFMQALESHRKQEGELDPGYFERLVAKAILFRGTRALLESRKLEFPAYRANIVTYAVARLFAETDGRLDLGRIWREQTIPSEMQQALLDLARSVQVFITTENLGGNVTEFCKKENSWQHFLKTDVFTDGGFERFKVSVAASIPKNATSAKAHELQEKIRIVTETPVETWFAIVEWGRSTGSLNALQCLIATETAGRIGSGQAFTAKQANESMKILEIAKLAGKV